MKETQYFGVYVDKNLPWNYQINQIKSTLSRSCGLLAKLRHYVKEDLLKTVYFAIFDQTQDMPFKCGNNTGIKPLQRSKKFN